MAADVACFMAKVVREPCNLVGHSMGGKVAMAVALLHPDLVRSVTVVDIAPVKYRVTDDMNSVLSIVRSLLALDISGITTRAEADTRLEPRVKDYFMRQFLLTNLVDNVDKNGEHVPGTPRFRWTCNLQSIFDSFHHLADFPLDAPGVQPFNKPALFVAGTKSHYIRPDAHRGAMQALFPHMELAPIEAGHFVHIEARALFTTAVLDFFARHGV
jgi:esterase